MRNTFIYKGSQAPEEIIAATKQGIYVASVAGGGEVDVVTARSSAPLLAFARTVATAESELTYDS